MKLINGLELLRMRKDDELECGTLIRTQNKNLILASCPPQPVYEYYKYTSGDKRFHRCDENGKLGAKGQLNFMNYETLNKEFEIIEKSNKIEKCKSYDNFESIDDYIEHLRYKINEIIDYINNGDK